MEQSYKIFINQISVILAQHKEGFAISKRIKRVTVYYINKLRDLKKLITAIEIGSIKENLIILSDDVDWLHDKFFQNFKIIVAGGGLVLNDQGQFLMMYRKKKWDIPKGKIEKGEDVKTGAIREVEEETGVKIKVVEKKLGITYHTYKLKDKWVLKETHWFLMHAKKNSNLVPQTDEGIEKVVWSTKKETKTLLKNSYASIKDVFEFYKQ